MIDSEIKKKIIKLYREGNSKSFISRNTGVSAPTIRAILRAGNHEHGGDEKKYPDASPLHRARLIKTDDTLTNTSDDDITPIHLPRSTCLNSTDSFIVNTSSNAPNIGVSPHDQLRNGVPIWTLQDNLQSIFPKDIAGDIVKGILGVGDGHGVFRVVISHSESGPRVYVDYLSRW